MAMRHWSKTAHKHKDAHHTDNQHTSAPRHPNLTTSAAHTSDGDLHDATKSPVPTVVTQSVVSACRTRETGGTPSICCQCKEHDAGHIWGPSCHPSTFRCKRQTISHRVAVQPKAAAKPSVLLPEHISPHQPKATQIAHAASHIPSRTNTA
jgi:hypothetical protein